MTRFIAYLIVGRQKDPAKRAGNVEAARLSGLPGQRILFPVYVIVGFFSSLAGFVLAAWLNSPRRSP